MSAHLNSEDVSRWIASDRPSGLCEHVSVCEECRTRVEGLGDAVNEFRHAFREFSAQEGRLTCFEPPAATMNWRLLWACGAATAALAFLLMFPRPAATPNVDSYAKADFGASDAELLEQVQQQVSRSVPQHMEPLADLFAWSFAPQNGESTARTGEEWPNE